jgi:hypothetical protein
MYISVHGNQIVFSFSLLTHSDARRAHLVEMKMQQTVPLTETLAGHKGYGQQLEKYHMPLNTDH